MKESQKCSFKYIEIPSNRVFYFYGDNLLESIELIELFEKFNKDKIELIEYGFDTVSRFIKKYKINNQIYTFVLTSYYHNGQLPDVVRSILIKNDKPDVIVYSLDQDKVIFGFESTVSTLAGNATWQRTARTTSFVKQGIPFAFLSYFSKKDKSAGEKAKPRRGSDLFVALYIALSLHYSVPALIGFYEHEDKAQNLTLGKHDWREEILQYLRALITNEESKDYYLRKCYDNMKNYYFGNKIERLVDTKNVFPNGIFEYVENANFSTNIVNHITEKKNTPLFNKNLTAWSNKKYTILNDDCGVVYEFALKDILNNQMKDIKFYQLTKACKAGITFETDKLIKFLNENSSHKGYFQDYINKNYPTVILPTKFRKKDSKKKKMISTEDPYNGEIPAFYELYKQSFGEINFILWVIDHSKENNYNVKKLQNTKVYRTINNYVNLVIDKDYNYLSNQSESAVIDSKSKYENEFVTESDVTCLFKILLSLENIDPSFINPPGGSWSDLKLYPTNDFYYYGRYDERADIAFYLKGNNTYYVGESKDNYKKLNSTLKTEEKKVQKIIDIIKDSLSVDVEFKRFAIFSGTKEEAEKILNNSNFDFVILVKDENKTITISTVER